MDYPTVRIALLPPPKPESQVTYFMMIWMALAGGLACLLVPVIGWAITVFLWAVFIPATVIKMGVLSGKRSLAKDKVKKAAKQVAKKGVKLSDLPTYYVPKSSKPTHYVPNSNKPMFGE